MAMITVQVWDATGNKRQEVELPDDVPIERILAVLVEKMNLPQAAPDGQPLSYKFHHRPSGKQLLVRLSAGQCPETGRQRRPCGRDRAGVSRRSLARGAGRSAG